MKIHQNAVDLLYEASFLPEGHFICFGQSYFSLRKLQFINGDNQVTILGRQFLKYDTEEEFKNKHRGSKFQDFLKEEGLIDE